MQKLDEAKDGIASRRSRSTRTARKPWYNLGLAQRADNELESALASFQQAVKIDPHDADSFYFEGACYQEMKQFDKAIAILRRGARDQSFARFGGVWAGAGAAAHGPHSRGKVHFARFPAFDQHQDLLGPRAAYGEQGHYSIVTPVEGPEDSPARMIPVKLVAEPMLSAAQRNGVQRQLHLRRRGGACMMDVTGSGQMDLVLMQSGAQAIRVLHRSGDGHFEELDAAAAGLKAAGHAVACAVGDYDGDGLNDLAVALDDRSAAVSQPGARASSKT